ncbi:protein ACCELERATED CELL DEATH 6-like [Camellia sinensis]|uniref:protein ACCELERATED CELL DEATH 6-like n=1 Tax=Camellia sinensis TaxID=4442 RepID=UPI001036D806|nr:protein ACCELERATED CELL DEATH 6-like [Camellia sinensis]
MYMSFGFCKKQIATEFIAVSLIRTLLPIAVTMNVNLYEAVMEGKVDVLRQHIDQIDNQVTPNNNTVLHVAAQFGRLQCVEEILKECPVLLRRVNSKCETPLHFAVREERLDVAKALIDCAKELDQELESGGREAKEILRATNEDKDTALHMAVRNGHLDLVKLLTGEDPEFQHPANNADETPLYLATEIGCDDVVSAILETSTSPAYGGPDGRTALHAAAIIKIRFSMLIDFQNKNQSMGRLLEWKQDLIKEADEYGWTPLHYAARCHNVEGVRQILKKDKSAAYITTADKDDEKTALHIAAAKGYTRVMKEILLHCPDCWEMVNGKGQNVLHVAMDMEKKGAIEFIKENPWSSHLKKQKDIEGNTPLHLLYWYGGVNPFSVRLQDSTKEWCNREYEWAFNNKNITPDDIQWSNHQDTELVRFGICGGRNIVSGDQELITKLRVRKEERQKICKEPSKTLFQDVKKMSDTHLIVATLTATISFAVGFTMPGGYNSNEGSKQGMPLLITKAAFKLFVIANTIAAICSTSSVFLYVTAPVYHVIGFDDKFSRIKMVSRYLTALFLLLIAVAALIVAFITGSYAVLSHSLGLAISVCLIGCISFLIYLIELQRWFSYLKKLYFKKLTLK